MHFKGDKQHFILFKHLFAANDFILPDPCCYLEGKKSTSREYYVLSPEKTVKNCCVSKMNTALYLQSSVGTAKARASIKTTQLDYRCPACCPYHRKDMTRQPWLLKR